MTIDLPIEDEELLEIYTDGASRGNPGPASYGFVFTAEGHDVFYKHAECIGTATNNQAEYTAVIEALDTAIARHSGPVAVHSDSQLLVNQLNGKWRVKDQQIKELWDKVQDRLQRINASFTHLPREHRYIDKADTRCNQALDSRG